MKRNQPSENNSFQRFRDNNSPLLPRSETTFDDDNIIFPFILNGNTPGVSERPSELQLPENLIRTNPTIKKEREYNHGITRYERDDRNESPRRYEIYENA